ncbi:hypothetical protein ACNI3K_11110 [Demequina sp. SO4-13]|uniref:hypothetical protein n=1 Tax=Demequina sp. SO4-13 TaxID=3401027 RepID=UPI003AF8DF7E
MLSSKYAPIVAITIVLILILAALGWFLAIKPQVDDTGAIGQEADEVRTNIDMIEQSSASIDNYANELEDAPVVTEAIALNAPNVWDMAGFRLRLDDAVNDSGVGITAFEQAPIVEIDGWEQDSAALPSAQVASLFQVGPIHTGDEEEYSPVVTQSGESGPVASGIVGVPLSIEVVGAPSEMLEFFTLMSQPDDALFQVFGAELLARQSDSAPIEGVSDPDDGDVTLAVSGYAYMLNPDATIVDEEQLEPASLGSGSPFEEIAGSGGGGDGGE